MKRSRIGRKLRLTRETLQTLTSGLHEVAGGFQKETVTCNSRCKSVCGTCGGTCFTNCSCLVGSACCVLD